MKSIDSVLTDVSLISKRCLLPRGARGASIIEKQGYQVVRGIMGKKRKISPMVGRGGENR